MEASSSPILRNDGHLNRESLGLHLLGDLAIFTHIRVEEHLAGCGLCRRRLQDMRQIVAALTGISPVPAVEREAVRLGRTARRKHTEVKRAA
jgi:predicted anti-sigma-YlaC factor YlaD